MGALSSPKTSFWNFVQTLFSFINSELCFEYFTALDWKDFPAKFPLSMPFIQTQNLFPFKLFL